MYFNQQPTNNADAHKRTNTMKTKEIMYEQIKQHGDNLNKLFKLNEDPIKLCKKLRKLEYDAHKLALDYCNGENGIDSENWEKKITPIMNKVYKLLNNGVYGEDRPHHKKVPVYLNGDARGYALKINDQYIRAYKKHIYTDMGGYGILAPQFDGK